MEEESIQQVGTSECVLVLFNWVWQVYSNECENNICQTSLVSLSKASGESTFLSGVSYVFRRCSWMFA